MTGINISVLVFSTTTVNTFLVALTNRIRQLFLLHLDLVSLYDDRQKTFHQAQFEHQEPHRFQGLNDS